MAYNSDGYIMIDFTDVDFRRTNQTIDGLFKRCVDVIGTNKFILVINANGRTPLPATCSFTNNQYVIDTVIYMFAVSSNDNLFIRRNDVPASDIIDDSSISVDKTWSSNKIDSELDTKADASSLADYQPKLTPVSPISIDESHNIEVDLSDYQPILTPGDYINITNNVISVDLNNYVKNFTYIGTGVTQNHDIVLPTGCHIILFIDADITPTGTPAYDYCSTVGIIPIRSSGKIEASAGLFVKGGAFRSVVPWHITFSEGKITTASSSNAIYNMNQLDKVYTVYYI